ncbi:short-chain dehydrogenase TIC 32 B, chloroplastic-like isoform X1 [Phragmites australis]|uniref:short-chain dehydrogenase TIC 32 B, chloroplastic-like isoform X1 n=1 Tax=Phragmites australis TaxID=29695 RepID=UPI002D792559|nr:short-chain dehydrogenase TIC 32 B, chloroplastic-like isoform X1 [Phragmites australis]
MLTSLRYLAGAAGPSGFSSRTTAEEATADCADLHHITAIITGATSGIGAETARVLAKRGARLVLPARSLKAAEEARARLRAECPGADVVVLPLDLSSLASVRRFVARFLALGLPLNLLVNNAGKYADRFAVSEDGVEMTFATNYLGHFLLTRLLLEKMAETARATGVEGRIVNVSSSIHSWFAGDDDAVGYLDRVTRRKIPYDPTRAYALSKLANVLHTKALAQRLKEKKANVTANCVHPGIVRTRLIRDRDGLVTSTTSSLPLLSVLRRAACASSVLPSNSMNTSSNKMISRRLQIQCSSWRPSFSRRFLRQLRRHATSPCTRRWPACPGSTSPTATRRHRLGWAPAARRPPSCGASLTP